MRSVHLLFGDPVLELLARRVGHAGQGGRQPPVDTLRRPLGGAVGPRRRSAGPPAAIESFHRTRAEFVQAQSAEVGPGAYGRRGQQAHEKD